jgi:hypothetical protein
MKKCEGCEWELSEAIILQEHEGLHQATSTDREIEDMEHFIIWMVDDKGKTQVW